MTTSHQIHYVNKVPRQDIHHAIETVGGKNGNGSVWRLNLSEAVAKVLDGTYQFFVSVSGRSVNITVAKSAAGHLYLKTEADSMHINNLLSLPEFP